MDPSSTCSCSGKDNFATILEKSTLWIIYTVLLLILLTVIIGMSICLVYERRKRKLAYMRSTHTKPELVATYPLDEEEEDTSKILNSVGNYDCNNYDEPLKLLADIKPETRYTSKAVTNADYCEPISIKTPSVVNEIGVQSSGYGYTEPTIKFTQTNTDGAYDNLDLYQKDDHSSSSGEGSDTQHINSTGTDTTDASTIRTVSAQYSNVIINNETTQRLETNFMQTEDKPQPVHIYATLEPPK